MMCPKYWNSESPSIPINATTPSGISVTVITTMRIVLGIGIPKNYIPVLALPIRYKAENVIVSKTHYVKDPLKK